MLVFLGFVAPGDSKNQNVGVLLLVLGLRLQSFLHEVCRVARTINRRKTGRSRGGILARQVRGPAG